MNRFSTYLASQKLAKMHLVEAELAWKKTEHHRAVGNLVHAVSQLMLACNNLASMQFEPKRKKKKAVTP